MARIVLLLTVFYFIAISYVLSAPSGLDQCQVEAARLYTKATISQRIEDANRIPLTSDATRYEYVDASKA